MVIKCDIKIVFESLYEKAIDCLTYDNIYNIDNNQLIKKQNHSATSQLGIVQYWIVFSTGIELLLKSKLLKHNSLDIKKKSILEKMKNLNKSAKNYSDSVNVYDFISSFEITSEDNLCIKKILTDEKISLLYELNLGTLGNCQSLISRLKNKDIISNNDYANLFNSIQVLSDVRRNFDMHHCSPLTVGGSINDDLEKLYLPMINFLLKL